MRRSSLEVCMQVEVHLVSENEAERTNILFSQIPYRRGRGMYARPIAYSHPDCTLRALLAASEPPCPPLSFSQDPASVWMSGWEGVMEGETPEARSERGWPCEAPLLRESSSECSLGLACRLVDGCSLYFHAYANPDRCLQSCVLLTPFPN